MKPSLPKFTNRTLQWTVTPKLRKFTVMSGYQKGWVLCRSENNVQSPWARAVTEERLCLQKESQTYHWPQQLSAWEPEGSKVEHKPLVHIYVFNRKWKASAAFRAALSKWLRLPKWFRHISQHLLLTAKMYRVYLFIFSSCLLCQDYKIYVGMHNLLSRIL